MKATHEPLTTPATDPMRPSTLLRGAALYLTRHGWTQDEFFANTDTDRPFPAACALGAINICAHGRPILCADADTQDTDTDAAITAARVFAASLDVGYASGITDVSAIDIVSGFNDEQHRTLNDIVQALTDAADDWDRTHHTGGAR